MFKHSCSRTISHEPSQPAPFATLWEVNIFGISAKFELHITNTHSAYLIDKEGMNLE